LDDLLAARVQMAVSLGFHMVFAVVGMAMPLLMVLAEWRFRVTSDAAYKELAQRWAKGTAILFAVGAVSGTVLSFELGLLWPGFMELAGPVVGMPFSLEGFAFFLEAIFLGIYLYGWDKLRIGPHLFAGVVVALSGLASGVFVVAVNAWMNTPAGFTLEHGDIASIDYQRAFFTPAFPSQAAHMVLAAYSSVAVAVLGVHAWRLLREPESRFDRHAAQLCLRLAAVVVPLQLFTGDWAAKQITKNQPLKLAAAEALFESQNGAPLAIGGIPDADARQLVGAIHVPKALSFLATGDFEAHVVGLDAFPREDWPSLPVVHLSFDAMVACGTAMAGLVVYFLWHVLRKRDPLGNRWFLRAAVASAPLGMIAVEAGWFVTEVGRQPWVVTGVLRTRDAVTPMPHLMWPMLGITALYVLLGVVVVLLLRAHVLSVPAAVHHEPSPGAPGGAGRPA
jgi:cytochrome d ubiquinol oxidase subunit I